MCQNENFYNPGPKKIRKRKRKVVQPPPVAQARVVNEGTPPSAAGDHTARCRKCGGGYPPRKDVLCVCLPPALTREQARTLIYDLQWLVNEGQRGDRPTTQEQRAAALAALRRIAEGT